MPQSYVSLPVHMVFSTKHRQPLITDDIRTRLFEYLGGTFRAHGCALLAAGGMPDHVHLLVSLSKQTAVSDILREVKASSSKWIHDTFPGQSGFAWQSGYGAFAVSHSNLPAVRRYIANQAEHHRQRSFQEEFIALLQRHEISYDERYLWE
ncbi:MAG: IS200/IS605 family transposase [Pirellulaceae bacterium]|nr:IS200/IS605 family transposase [Pirellulaceae bacterium]